MPFKGDLEALILGALQGEPLHGYEIAKRIREAGSDSLTVAEGRLYPALHRLERDEFVTAHWIPQEGKPSRKVYCLTDKGKAELVEHKARWQEFVKGVAEVLNTPAPEVSRG